MTLFQAAALGITICFFLLAIAKASVALRASIAKYFPPVSPLARVVSLLTASVGAFLRVPLPASLAVVATWAMFLLAPGMAEASTLAGTAHGGLFALLGLGLALGIAAAPTPATTVTPGNQTSEFSLTKFAMIAGNVLAALGVILASLQVFFPSDSKAGIYVSLAIVFIGKATSLLSLFGYNSGRVDVKVAAAQADGAKAAAPVQAAASKSPEAAADALK